MRVMISGKAQELNDSYAARLIEQGKAVPAPKKREKAPVQEAKTAKKGKTEDGPEGQDRG